MILLLAATIVLATALPALAGSDYRFTQSIVFRIGGKIDIYREVGHMCTTGAKKTQIIRGYGEMTRTEDVIIAPNIMSIDEKTDWTTFPDAIRNLIVTTTIELCARPMSAAAHAYDSDGFDIREGDIIHTYHPLVVGGYLEVNELTWQQWGMEIETNRGHSGSYHADFIAAYGPGPYEEDGILGDYGELILYEEDHMWWFDFDEEDGIDRGRRYVGNYFEIEQLARTTEGYMKRFIDISSPFSNTYISERLIVTGYSEIKEAFLLDNLEPGPDAIRLTWWELF